MKLCHLAVSLIIFAYLILPSSIEACGRCGYNYCHGCNTKVVTVTQPQLYPQQVINISNVYPQGTTGYAASIPQLYGGNPDIAVKAAELVTSQGQSNLQAAIQYGQNTNLALAQIEQRRLAVEHIKAFNSSGDGGLESLTLNINQTGGGLQALKTPDKVENGSGQQQNNGFVVSLCGKCHGATLAQPKGGLVLDIQTKLPGDDFARAVDIIRGNNVPEAMKTLISGLTNEQKAGLLEELLTAWNVK